ncbi:MAG: hypothetical protein AAB802_04900 [Patescibacteria group bacterium]
MLKRNFHNHNLHYGQKLVLGLPRHIFATADPADDPSLGAADRAEMEMEKKIPDRKAALKERAVQLDKVPDIGEVFTKQRPSTAMLQKEVPGLEEAYVDPERFQAEEKQTHLLTEYNGVRNYIQYFEGVRITLADPKTDYEDFRWIGKIDDLAKQISAMNDAMNGSRFTMGKFTLSTGTLARIKSKNREEVLGAMDHILDQFRRLENEALKNLKAHMKEDFMRRVAWLRGQWENHTPVGYETVKANHMEILSRAYTALDGLSDQESLEEYNKVHQEVSNFEDVYVFAVETSKNPYSVVELEKEFQALIDLKKEKIDPVVATIESEVDKTLALLDELEAKIKDPNGIIKDDGFRSGELKTLESFRERLIGRKGEDTGYKGLDKSFDRLLLSEEARKDKDGNQEVLQMAGQSIPLKEGLKSQIEILKNSSLPAEELRKYSLGLHEAFERARNLMISTADYKINDLKPFREQIQTQLNIYNEPVPDQNATAWVFLSPYDFKTGFDKVTEWAKRRYTRASTYRVGVAGSQVFKPLETMNIPLVGAALKTLPNEFDQAKENAEQEEVNRYKQFMANKDEWQVMDIARTTENQDEFKACLFLLSEYGRIRWDDPQILGRFNYFQKNVYFNIENAEGLSAETANQSRFYDKLRRACGMWDYGTFNGLENTNNSNYESRINGYYEKFDRLAEQPGGGLQLRLYDLLKAHKNVGRDAKVDPHEYEGIIRYAIDKGRMSPEDRMYYLIQGIAVGLLNHNRASAINSKSSNNFPPIEYFAASTKRGPKATVNDIIEVAAIDYEQNKPGPLFKEWFHTKAMKLPGVTQRLDKALTQGLRLDHDDQGSYGCHMGAGTMENLLTARADGFQLPSTGVQNVSSSMLFWLDSKAKTLDHTDPQDKQDLARLVASFTTLDAISNDRMYRGKTNYFRWTPSSLDANPRVDGQGAIYGRKDMTVRNYLEKTQSYIKLLDPQFFTPLFEGKVRTDADVKMLVAKLEERYPGLNYFGESTGQITGVDQLYKSVETYVNFLLERNPKVALDMAKKIDEDHKAFDVEQKKKNEETLEDKRLSQGQRTPQIFEAIKKDREKNNLTNQSYSQAVGSSEEESFKEAA